MLFYLPIIQSVMRCEFGNRQKCRPIYLEVFLLFITSGKRKRDFRNAVRIYISMIAATKIKIGA